MFTTVTTSPTLTTTTSVTTPAPPSRPSRLRGLSYLRNYTHAHLHSRDSSGSSTGSNSRPSIQRATSYPSPSNTPTPRATPAPPTPNSIRSPVTQSSNSSVGPSSPVQESPVIGPAGWVPIVGGQSAITRTPSQTSSIPNIATPLASPIDTSTVGPIMGRTRSATTSRATEMAAERPAQTPFGSVPTQSVLDTEPPASISTLPSIRFSQHQDARAPRPSLVFSPMQRTLPSPKDVIRVGRYSEREQIPNQPYNVPSAAPVGFKSKVVSRRHCEFWSQDGTWYIKDVKSSSGTFLNHVRLSSPGQESKPFAVKDGDIVQLGIDFKGGEEMIFRCVKIRIELNRNWQNSLNTFNVASHKRLRKLAQENASQPGSSQDCSICLGPVAPCQALFVAPCSHTWHYKCVRRILNGPMWPQFICPNCRAVADLEAEVDEPYDADDWEEVEAEEPTSNPPDVAEPEAASPAATPDDIAQQVQTAMAQFQLTAAEIASQIVPPQTNHAAEEPEMVLDEEAEHNTRAAQEISTDESDEDIAAAQASHVRDLSPPSDNGASLSALPSPDPQTRQVSTSLNAMSPAITIPKSRNGSIRNVEKEEARSPSPPTPVSGRAKAPGLVDLSAPLPSPGELGEGPMTPRNDFGPFVFDGSAGRSVVGSRPGTAGGRPGTADGASKASTLTNAAAAAAVVEDDHEKEGHPL